MGLCLCLAISGCLPKGETLLVFLAGCWNPSLYLFLAILAEGLGGAATLGPERCAKAGACKLPTGLRNGRLANKQTERTWAVL